MADPTNIPDAWREHITNATLFLVIGVVIGLGQLLSSNQKLTPRIVIGRAICTGGLGMAAGVALIWFPNIPLSAQIGMAAALASLGTSGLERMFQRWAGGAGS